MKALGWTGVRWGILAGAGILAVSACADLFANPTRIAHYNVRACTNVGNDLDAPKDEDWGYRIEARHFDIIKDAGFDSVRIPVRWSDHAATGAPYTIDPDFMARVVEVVDQALARDLEVILNIHHYNEFYERPYNELDRFVGLWQQIAERFKHHPLLLHFELLNEPRDALKGAILRDALNRSMATIRQSNPARVVIVGGADWNSLTGLEEMPVLNDPYTVGTFHYYDPHPFTHQGVTWEEEPPEVGATWGTAEDKAALKAAAERAAAQVARLKRPVFMGEFGVYGIVPDDQRVAWYGAVRAAFEDKGIGWCTWNFASDFSLWDPETEDWRPGALEALGLTRKTGISEAN